MARRTRISLLSCAFALAFAGCGSGSNNDTIPPSDAENLLNLVTAVQDDVSNGDCERAQAHAKELVSQVDQLPGDVDPEVASELAKAAVNLEGLSSSDCVDTGASGVGGAQPSTSTTETVAPTTTTQTSTTTTEPETTTTTKPDNEPTQDPNAEQPGGQNQGGGSSGGGVEPPSGGGGGG